MVSRRACLFAIAVCVCLLAGAPYAVTQDAGAAAKVTTVRRFSATTTASGQPIVLPGGNAEVVVWTYDIPAGARLPVHKHPFPRYAFVLSGTLRVVTPDETSAADLKFLQRLQQIRLGTSNRKRH